jgi:hypothetical protein
MFKTVLIPIILNESMMLIYNEAGVYYISIIYIISYYYIL